MRAVKTKKIMGAVLAQDQIIFENLKVHQFKSWLHECPVEILDVAWVKCELHFLIIRFSGRKLRH